MSRIRSVHPGFFTDSELVSCSAFARLLFIGLGVQMADDKGTFQWKPIDIKMKVFPGDSLDINKLLSELIEVNAIAIYEIGGRKYGAIKNFRKFQRPKTPNDVNPITPEISIYVSLTKAISETHEDGEDEFPPKGEKSPQREEGGDKRKEEEIKDTPHSPPVFSEAVDLWNQLAGEFLLPSVQSLNKTRISKLSARLRDCGGITGWSAMLQKIRGSPFLTGKTEKPFMATFDWVISETNFTKIMEGNYDDKSNGTSKTARKSQWKDGHERYIAELDAQQMEHRGQENLVIGVEQNLPLAERIWQDGS